MATIINGKELALSLKQRLAADVATFDAKYGRTPHLVVILVVEDAGSVSYVTGKAKASAEVGIRNTTIRKPDTITEAELLGIIDDVLFIEDPYDRGHYHPRIAAQKRVAHLLEQARFAVGINPVGNAHAATLQLQQPRQLLGIGESMVQRHQPESAIGRRQRQNNVQRAVRQIDRHHVTW